VAIQKKDASSRNTVHAVGTNQSGKGNTEASPKNFNTPNAAKKGNGSSSDGTSPKGLIVKPISQPKDGPNTTSGGVANKGLAKKAFPMKKKSAMKEMDDIQPDNAEKTKSNPLKGKTFPMKKKAMSTKKACK
jgi:hypothetical protein